MSWQTYQMHKLDLTTYEGAIISEPHNKKETTKVLFTS